MSSTELKRLNKFISESGFCSRREADALIEQGKVTINGVVPELGTKVSTTDEVAVDGKIISASAADKSDRVYIIYHKPAGVTCTTERDVYGNIIDAIGHSKRIFPIGRLDKPSEGLILLTSDGDIVNKILRAENAHDKEYEVTVDTPVSPRFAQRMEKGVPILGTMTKPCKVNITGRFTFNITLTQGLNRQIRRMCEFLGYEVEQLKRVRVMHFNLKGLKPGQWRELTAAEMDTLNTAVAASRKTSEKAEFIEKVQSNLRTGKHTTTDTDEFSEKKSDYVFRGEGRSGHTFADKPANKSSVWDDAPKSDSAWGDKRQNDDQRGPERGNSSRGDSERRPYRSEGSRDRPRGEYQNNRGEGASDRPRRDSERKPYRSEGSGDRPRGEYQSRRDDRSHNSGRGNSSSNSGDNPWGAAANTDNRQERGQERNQGRDSDRRPPRQHSDQYQGKRSERSYGRGERPSYDRNKTERGDNRSSYGDNDRSRDNRGHTAKREEGSSRGHYQKRDDRGSNSGQGPREDRRDNRTSRDRGDRKDTRDSNRDNTWSKFKDERPRGSKPKLTRYTPPKKDGTDGDSKPDSTEKKTSANKLSLKKKS